MRLAERLQKKQIVWIGAHTIPTPTSDLPTHSQEGVQLITPGALQEPSPGEWAERRSRYNYEAIKLSKQAFGNRWVCDVQLLCLCEGVPHTAPSGFM